MKNERLFLACLPMVSAILLHSPALLAQGSLTPPGAPAPTMKTLAQVEPRSPISSAPFTITEPGSYYLTTNLTVSSGDAITLATNEVTLDLNGFTISSTANPAAGYGVRINSGLWNIAIQNGHIRGGVTNNGSGAFSGPGFGYGISYSGAPQNVRVSGVSVSGCRYDGINVGSDEGSTVKNCVVRTVGGYGIVASIIRGCIAMDCGSRSIYGLQVSDSRGQSDTGYGLYADTAALNCYGVSSSGTGLYALDTATGCHGSSVSGVGLYATTAQNCFGYSYSGTGLSATAALNCYGSSNSGLRGLHALNAAFCGGQRSGGRAIEAIIANGCYAQAGTNLITYKYNMP